MRKYFKWGPILIAVGVAMLIEVAYAHVYPAIESAALRHVGDMQNVEFAFFLPILICIWLLWYSWYRSKFPWIKLPVIIVLAALIHVNFLTGSIDCCPGG